MNDALSGDAVDELFIDGDAGACREAAVALEGRDSARLDDKVVYLPVYLLRGQSASLT